METARSLARHLTEPDRRLDLSYPFSVGESGHVTSDHRERILAVTPAERRAMGIAKNTWHYISWSRTRAYGLGAIPYYLSNRWALILYIGSNIYDATNTERYH